MTAVVPPADLVLPTRSSSLASTAQLARLLAGPTLADRASWALPVTAFGVVSALSLSVAGGVQFFLRVDGPMAAVYQLCAMVALVLLILPLATLAGAAAKLSTSRRDVRLSSLRLIGATSTTVRLLTLLETSAMALSGALIGVVGYLALMPLFGLIPFLGGPIGAGALWLGPLPILGAVAAIVALAVLSSAVGLRRVVISPLGVRTRDKASRAGLWRLVLGVVAIVGAMMMASFARGSARDMAMAIIVGLVSLAIPLVALNLIGPWVLGMLARADLRAARTPQALLAARTVLEDPRRTWRQVGSLSLASFVAVFLGAGLSKTASMPQSRPEDVMLTQDVGTGVLLTLALTFVTIACSVGINQSAAILDRRGLYVGLDMIGTPMTTIDGARRRAVMRPLLAVVLISTGAGLALAAPMALLGEALDPTALMVVAGTLAGGVLLIWGGLVVSRTTLVQVIRTGLVRSE